MPQYNEFWNPYRFVPRRPGQLPRRKPQGHHLFNGWLGTIDCELEALSSLVTGQERFTRKRSANNLPVIPGTSLKGVFRSVAEIVGHGCPIVNRDNRCRSSSSLCAACRIFGYLGRGVHAGHVSISDAVLIESPVDPTQWERIKVRSGRPDPHHKTSYPTDTRLRWHKLYHHQPRRTKPAAYPHGNAREETVEYAPAGSRFRFSVTVENLSSDDLGLLLYVLELEPGMAHKVGGCKALGAGSSVVRIVDWDLRRGENRFRTQAAKEEVMEEIGRYKEQYINDNSETMQALRALMRWDPNDTREIRFPDRNWFNRNPQTKLRTWQEYAGRNARP